MVDEKKEINFIFFNSQREAEIEALLTQQASNAENRVQTLQEELTIEKENAQLLIEV